MSTAREREARTVRERLDKSANLSSPINSQRLDSFAKFFPGTVGRDYSAGGQMGQIARALGMFEPGLEKLGNALIDRKIAEGDAAAYQWEQENPEQSQTMEAFRKLALSDPKFQNLSPYVKKAVEGLVRENEAFRIQAQVIDNYNTSGLKNERDPAKVQKAIAEMTSAELQRSGLANDKDPLMFAQHVKAPLERMQAGLLAQHNRDVESQNVNLLFEQASQEFDNIFFGQTNVLNKGKDINLPRDRATVNSVMIQAAQTITKKLTNLGMREDQIMPFLQAQLLSGKLPASQAEAIAGSVAFDRNGEKVSLASQPGFAKALSKLKDDEMDRAWKGEVRGRQRAAWAREDAARNGANWAVQDAFNGKSLSESLKARGLDKADASTIQAYREGYNLASSVQFTSAYSTPERAAQAHQLHFDLITGVAGREEVLAQARSGNLTAEEGKSFIGIAAANATEEGRLLAAATTEITEKILAANLNISRAEAGQLMQQATLRGVTDMPEAYAEALRDAQAQGMAFYQEYEQSKKEAKKSRLDYADVQRLKSAYLTKSVSINTNNALEEKSAKALGKQLNTVKSLGEQISPDSYLLAQKMVWAGLPVDEVKRTKEIASIYQDSLNAFNTMLPSWKEMVPDNPDALAKLNKNADGTYRLDSLADMLTLGQALLGKAFTSEYSTSIILGKVIPEGSMTKVQQQHVVEERIRRMHELGVK